VTKKTNPSFQPDIPNPPHNQGSNVRQGDLPTHLQDTLKKLREEVARIESQRQAIVQPNTDDANVDVIDYANRFGDTDSQ
jgi:hypothetical protein